MLLRSALLIGISSLALLSCKKEEPIQPPCACVPLNAHFYGEFNTAPVEFTENVLGYQQVASSIDSIFAPPLYSKAVYTSEMTSNQLASSIKIGMGTVTWDASLQNRPSLTHFNSLFNNNLTPSYSTNAENGFEFSYVDNTGREWKSSGTSAMPMNVEFTSVVQESDNQGDYSRFVCNFDCWIYSFHPDSLALNPSVYVLDSIHVEDAVYEGWFMR